MQMVLELPEEACRIGVAVIGNRNNELSCDRVNLGMSCCFEASSYCATRPSPPFVRLASKLRYMLIKCCSKVVSTQEWQSISLSPRFDDGQNVDRWMHKGG